jgi:hypothetical protein
MITFTQTDLDNAKAALASGALEVMIGDRRVKYRSQKELIELIEMITAQLDGTGSTSDNPTMIQPGFSRGGR